MSPRGSPKSNSGEAGPSKPASNPFIIVDTTAKIDPAARKQIRSHVMRGKNRKRHGVDREKVAPGSWIGNQPGGAPPDSQAVVELPNLRIPRRVGNDMSHLQFIETMDPYMVDLTFQWFSILKQAAYPVEACVQPEPQQWVEPLAYDRAYTHSILFATQAFFDWAREKRFSNIVFGHLNRCISSLRENLLDNERAVSDSTIATVITLGLMADLIGDVEAERKHVEGLYKLVQLRGGIRQLSHNQQLQSKALRTDLGLAINTGSKPLFFSEGFSWDAYLHKPKPSEASQPTAPSHTTTLFDRDQRLLNVYFDLQEFSRAANIAFQTGVKMGGAQFQETLVSVQYRLLALQHEHDSIHKPFPEMLVSLGMLAFSTTTFLQIRALPQKYHHLEKQLRDAVQALRTNDAEESQQEQVELTRLKLWFLMVACISVLGGPEDEAVLIPATKEVLGKLGLLTSPWSEVRDVLREIMWIDWVHSNYGQAFFRKVISSEDV
ncbi:hypothetical protein QBC35DRAFT_395685 [Podospora australis]|uniref:C6 transcription factor n=1 Tax=Podospora australis TaxID=1536484 RepID=A0AAN6WJ46_9PEZI|nr:hypothetical protein QBC35DRAFT_395685 [Podospora australis]